MMKLLKLLVGFLTVDAFFFSTTLTFTYGVNTKMMLAVVGLLFLAFDIARNRAFLVSRELMVTTAIAVLVSMCAFASTIYNNTVDDSYVTYFMSMWVWFSAAYAVVRILRAIHGKIDIDTVAAYIIVVSLCQGLLAVWADTYMPAKDFINRFVPGMGWVDRVDRLYGFGQTACLDTGGLRFSIALVLCAYSIPRLVDKDKVGLVPVYFFAFLIISITGNMVARTATVGMLLGLVYLILKSGLLSVQLGMKRIRALIWVAVVLVVVALGATVLYNTDANFHENMRFGFEGFFSLFEKGEWDVSSNNKLKTMYVFPDNVKTWIIGDGYFNNPSYDKNYLGEYTDGYYMNTDVGYLRFLFYFGLLGLLSFVWLIVYSAKVCFQKFNDAKLLSLILLALSFAIWLKVATDCFFIFAVLMSVAYVRDILPATEMSEEENLDEDSL